MSLNDILSWWLGFLRRRREGGRKGGRGKERGETGMRKKVKKVEVRKSYLQQFSNHTHNQPLPLIGY